MEPSDEVVVREARSGEYETIGDLVVGAYRTLGDAGDAFYEEQLRDVAGRAGHSEVLVADLGSIVVGTVTYVPGGRALAHVDDPEAATIRMLGVAPEARGRGVGEALVRYCIDRARAAGHRRFRLDTRTSMTSAQRLYERLGFQREASHDWSPAPGLQLLAYVLELEPGRVARSRAISRQ
ncbi:MAG: GNAT family N-acetyltransferase [Chloroflexota bacterium]